MAERNEKTLSKSHIVKRVCAWSRIIVNNGCHSGVPFDPVNDGLTLEIYKKPHFDTDNFSRMVIFSLITGCFSYKLTESPMNDKKGTSEISAACGIPAYCTSTHCLSNNNENDKA